MKRIIDIPEPAFNSCKSWVELGVATWQDTLIANSIPYEEGAQAEWIPVSERLPEEKLFNPSGSDFGFDFEKVLCTTIWGDVRAYKFGKPIGHDKAHFWNGGGIMDEYVIAWQYKPKPYKEGSAE